MTLLSLRSLLAGFILAVVCLSLQWSSTSCAQPPDSSAASNEFATSPEAYVRYQSALAEQLRQVGQSVLSSVVTVETVGVLRSGGEVRQDAPTCGVIVDAEGYVLTSSMVTRGEAATILVLLGDGTRLPAEIVAQDTHRELVLLRVDPGENSLTPIRLDRLDGPSRNWTIGQTVVAVARYGEANQPLVSSGILSAVDRLDGTTIQTDARVSPVFYGGPLLNLRGECLGILIPAVGQGGGEDATAWYDSGIAFAVPSDVVVKKLETLRSGEDVRRGLAGLVVAGRDPYAAGTELSAVMPRSPAEKAGLQAGDELIRVAGRAVRRQQEVKLALGPFDAGDEVTVAYRRDGKESSVSLTLVESIPPLTPQWLGLTARPIETGQAESGDASETEPEQERPAEETGVVVTRLINGGPSDGKLQVGDRLHSLNGLAIENVDELRRRLWTAEPDQTMRLRLTRRAEGADAKDVSQDDAAPPPEKMEAEIDPQSLGGPVSDSMLRLASAQGLTEGEWSSVNLRLTDVPNSAIVWMPEREVQASLDEGVGLLVVVLPPTTRDVSEAMEAWKEVSVETGVAVCLIASEADNRWSGKEVDAVSKLTAAVVKNLGIDRDAVAIAGPAVVSDSPGEKVGPADSMALAVALLAEQQFTGAALARETKPPAVRLRRDGPLRMIRVLLPAGDEDDEGPSWSKKMTQLGYPTQTLPDLSRRQLLRWVASLRAL